MTLGFQRLGFLFWCIDLDIPNEEERGRWKYIALRVQTQVESHNDPNRCYTCQWPVPVNGAAGSKLRGIFPWCGPFFPGHFHVSRSGAPLLVSNPSALPPPPISSPGIASPELSSNHPPRMPGFQEVPGNQPQLLLVPGNGAVSHADLIRVCHKPAVQPITTRWRSPWRGPVSLSGASIHYGWHVPPSLFIAPMDPENM